MSQYSKKLRETFIKKMEDIGYLTFSSETGIAYQTLYRFAKGKSIRAETAIKIIKELKLNHTDL